MAENELAFNIEYIRYAVAVALGRGADASVEFKYCIQWRNHKQDNDEYHAENIQDEYVLRQFWEHLDERTIPPEGLYAHGWRAYSNQAYRDAKLLEDIDRRRLELANEASRPGITQERAEALRPSRDESEPDALAEVLRGRSDFSLVGDCVDEAGLWEFRPPRGRKARAPAPFPTASRRPSPDALQHDYRIIVLQEDLEDPEDFQALQSYVDDDARVLFSEDGWPASMQRIPFNDEEIMQKTLLSTLGKDFVRRLTRWWRRPENHDVCNICFEDAYDVWEDLVCIGCMHMFCKKCITEYWKSMKTSDAICPSCKQLPKHCPFPAAALIDPWRAGIWPPALPLDAGAAEREEGEIEGAKKVKKRRGGAKAKKQRQHQAAAAAAASHKR